MDVRRLTEMYSPGYIQHTKAPSSQPTFPPDALFTTLL